MTCAICAQALTSPKTRTVDGQIVEQCVARCHDASVLARDDDRALFLNEALEIFKRAGANRVSG